MPEQKEPKRLRLLKVTPEGYLVGTSEARKSTQLLIPHEAAVAIFTGLIEDENALETAVAGELDSIREQYIRTGAVHARRILGSIAWTLEHCSWDNNFRAIPYDGNPFHQSD